MRRLVRWVCLLAVALVLQLSGGNADACQTLLLQDVAAQEGAIEPAPPANTLQERDDDSAHGAERLGSDLVKNSALYVGSLAVVRQHSGRDATLEVFRPPELRRSV